MPAQQNTLWIYFLNTVVFGLIVYIIQKAISNSSDRKLADFRGHVDLQLLSYKNLYDQQLVEYKIGFDRQMEQYKSELKLINDKFSALHNRRLDVIKELNDKLVMINSSMVRLVSMRPIHQDEQKENEIKETILKEAQEAYAGYNNFILFNKIYFSEKFADKLELIRREYFSAHWDLFEPERLQNMGLQRGEAFRESGQKVLDASKRIREEIPKMIIEIEVEFRNILGVEH